MINGLIRSSHPLFLASVRTPEEARVALSGGADVIDCKDPANGALGALSGAQIASVCDAVAGRVPVSATVGDLPTDARLMVNAARATAAAGADIVKVGFFGDAPAGDAVAALGDLDLGAARLVAVLMADRDPDFSLIGDLAAAGFLGVMLDTADKASGALPDVIAPADLKAFVAAARAHGLIAGLAGSLRLAHVPAIAAHRPDIIGFRGALCDGSRSAALSPARVEEVRRALDATALSGPEALERSVA